MFRTFLALTPILWLLISLGALKFPAHKASPIGLLLSLLIATTIWEMNGLLAVLAAWEGVLFSLVPILWVIVAAFFNYNLSQHTGAIDHIKELLFRCSADRRIQALVIAWGFGSFMESVAGFGTAVAVPAALLIALGFDPFRAAVVCLIANTVAVAFGVVGIPVTTLEKITELPIGALSWDIGLQLTPFVFLVPIFVVYSTTGSLAGLRGVWLITLLAGASFGIVQFAVAQYVGPELPAIVASLASTAVILLAAKVAPSKQIWRFPDEPENADQSPQGEYSPSLINGRTQLVAWLPYILLLCLVLATSRLFPAIHEQLRSFRTVWLVFSGAGGKPLVFEWLLTPGTMVFAALFAKTVRPDVTATAKNDNYRHVHCKHGESSGLQRHGRLGGHHSGGNHRRVVPGLCSADRRARDVHHRQRYQFQHPVRAAAKANSVAAGAQPRMDRRRQYQRRLHRQVDLAAKHLHSGDRCWSVRQRR